MPDTTPTRYLAIWRHLRCWTTARPGGACWARWAHSETVGVHASDKRSLPYCTAWSCVSGCGCRAQGTLPGGRWRARDARALFTGVAAHASSPLSLAGAGLIRQRTHLRSAADPGKTQAIADALIADLRAHGGRLAAGVEITEPQEVWSSSTPHPPPCCGFTRDKLPHRYAKALRRYRFRAGIAKVDFVLSDEIPWSDPRLRRAATLHLGGTATRWCAPRQTSRRDATPTGRCGAGCVRTSPTLAASTKPAAVRSGPMPTCRRGPRSTRPRP